MGILNEILRQNYLSAEFLRFSHFIFSLFNPYIFKIIFLNKIKKFGHQLALQLINIIFEASGIES